MKVKWWLAILLSALVVGIFAAIQREARCWTIKNADDEYREMTCCPRGETLVCTRTDAGG